MTDTFVLKKEEFRISAFDGGTQARVTLLPTVDGGFSGVWVSRDQDGSDWGVVARFFNKRGSPDSGEIIVNSQTEGRQFGVGASLDEDDRLLVSYANERQDIFIQEVAPSGRLGNPQGIVSSEKDAIYYPLHISLENGSIGLFYTAESEQGIANSQLLTVSPRGVASDALTLTSQPSRYSETINGDIAKLNDGNTFVVVWNEGDNQEVGDGSIYFQLFNLDGTAAGIATKLNGSGGSEGIAHAQVAPLGEAGFVISWRDTGDGLIYYQRFDDEASLTSGGKVDTSFDGFQSWSEVVSMPDGGFTIIWTDFSSRDGDDGGIFAQRFDSAAEKIGPATQINSQSIGSQDSAKATVLSDGSLVVAYKMENLEGDGSSIWGKIYEPITFGTNSKDTLAGSAKSDVIDSRAGSDIVVGKGGKDSITGGSGNDSLKGGKGNDQLRGAQGNDRIEGGNGFDNLSGGSGRDALEGGKGDDILKGGKGADRFIFSKRFGDDTIEDFDALGRKEKIDLSQVPNISSLGDLRSNHLSQVGDDVVIHSGANKITLANVDIEDLGRADFIF